MRTWALIRRICQQMLRDKRTFPDFPISFLAILTLMYFIFNGNEIDPSLGAVNLEEGLIVALEQEEVNVIQYEHANKETINKEELDGLLEWKNGKFLLTLKNSELAASNALQMKVNQAINIQMRTKLNNQSNETNNLSTKQIDTDYVYGNSETEYFDVFSPVLIG